MKLLLYWNTNWADEMDIEGFAAVTSEFYEQWKSNLRRKTTEFEIGLGTNEAIEFNNGEHLIKKVKCKEITDEEFDVLNKLFGSKGAQVVCYAHSEFWFYGMDWILDDEEFQDDNDYLEDEEE